MTANWEYKQLRSNKPHCTRRPFETVEYSTKYQHDVTNGKN